MARKVFVSSDMSADEKLIEVAETSAKAALLWPWLLTAFDDWGRAEAQPKRLKATTFPMNDLVSADDVADAIVLYAEHGLIVRYEVDGKPYMAIESDKWFKYQTHIRKEKREKDDSRHPAPPSEPEQVREDARDCAQVREDARICTPSPSPSRAKDMCVPFEPEPHDCDPAETGEPAEPPPTNQRNVYPEDFERFWQAYPPNRRVRKKHAHKAWSAQQKRKQDERAPPEALIAAAEHYAAECAAKGTEARYVMHPATFLGPNDPYADYLQPAAQAEAATAFDEDPDVYMARLRAEKGDVDEPQGGGRTA